MAGLQPPTARPSSLKPEGAVQQGADDVHRPLLLKYLYRLVNRAVVAFSIHMVGTSIPVQILAGGWGKFEHRLT